MDLLIVRHGVAENKKEFAKTGKSDDVRPLTDKGRKEMKRAARGLRTIVPEVGLLATSPLVRAQQTAEYIADAFDVSIGEVVDVLKPDAPLEAFIEWLRPRADKSPVCVVGHEPHLSSLATWLMSGVKDSRLALAKGGACLLSFDGEPQRGGAELRWLLPAKQLDAVGSSHG